MPIDIGDELPPLALRNENDEDVVLSLITEHRGAIIFLVPKVDTREYLSNIQRPFVLLVSEG